MITNYELLIKKIAKQSSLSVDDVKRRVEAKIAKLSNLISKEGAAQVVAAELGIFFDEQKVKVNELLSGMRKISIVGKIIRLFPVRTFKTRSGESKVASFLLGDETGNLRCVLWDINHIALIEQGNLYEGSFVEIKNASVRGEEIKEIHLGSTGEVKETSERIENVIEQEVMIKRKISALSQNENAAIRAAVVQAFEPHFFSVCPECNAKLVQENNQFLCQTHSFVAPKERAIFNMVIDDGSGNIRAACFSEVIEKLFDCGIAELKGTDLFLQKKEEMLGKEFLFTGRTKLNKVFNRLEFIVQKVDNIDVDSLITELSKSKA